MDSRTEKNIATLHPNVRPVAKKFIEQTTTILPEGIVAKIISGTRTYAEQNALYEQGRTKPGPRVTNARGGYSNHNFGVAWDIGLFQGSRYLGESPWYKKLGSLAKDLDLDWGGNWTSFKDEPHYQLRPKWAKGMKESAMLAEFRARVRAGKDIFDAA